MALFSNIIANSQDPEEQQAALQLQAQTNNSVMPQSVLNAPVSAADMQQAQPAQTQVIPQDSVPAGQVSNQAQESTGSSEQPGILQGLANLFTDPAFLQSANAFASSLAGDKEGYQNNINAYAQTMNQRRAEQASKFNAQLARKQELEDRASDREWQEKAAYRSSLYKNYTPESVQDYLQNGDASTLKQLPIDPYQAGMLQIAQQNADTNESNSLTKYAAATQSRLGSVDEEVRAPRQEADGSWSTPHYDSKGRYTGYQTETRPETIKALNANKSSQTPTAGEYQMNKDLQELYDANQDGKTNSFTGQLVGRSEVAQDLASSILGDDTSRKAYRSAQRIDGMMLSQGVADAKNMGASGINTKAEAEMYFRSMPRLDYTSQNALDTSIKQINDYTKNFNASKRTSPNATAPTNTIPKDSAPASTGGIPSGWSVKKN